MSTTLPPTPTSRAAHAPRIGAVPRVEPPAERCADCDAPLVGRFCAACGQDRRDAHRSLRALAAEVVDSLLGWDGKIPATLWLLVRRPGALTVEYLAGRRGRYLRPLRLYLMASVVFLLTLRAAGDDGGFGRVVAGADDGPAATATRPGAIPAGEPATLAAAVERARTQPRGPAALDSARLGAFLANRPGEGTRGTWSAIKKRYFKDRLRALSRMPEQERGAVVRDAFLAKLGNMIFALVPVFALLVRLLWRRRGLYYAEHLVFGLHVHAFAMAALALAVVLPPPWAALPVLAVPAYLLLALRRVYGDGWGRTVAKSVVLAGAYGTALLTATVTTALLAVMLG